MRSIAVSVISNEPMKCEICKQKTNINWGNGEITLCKEHEDSDIVDIEIERTQQQNDNHSCIEDRLSPQELKEQQWRFYHFGPPVTLGLVAVGASPGIAITAVLQANYLLLIMLLPVISLRSTELWIMLNQHKEFMLITKRTLIMFGLLNIGFLNEGVFVVALTAISVISIYWLFRAQHYFYITDFRK